MDKYVIFRVDGTNINVKTGFYWVEPGGGIEKFSKMVGPFETKKECTDNWREHFRNPNK